MQQFVVGLAMGFMVRIVMAGVEMAGEVAGLTMGLGFATFLIQKRAVVRPRLAQFLVIITTLIILALNIHLAMFEALVMSFKTIPISRILRNGFWPPTS